MKIEKAESWVLRFPFIREGADASDDQIELIGVTLDGEDGSSGIGFTYTLRYGGAEAVKASIDHFCLPRIVGRDAEEHSAIWHDIWWTSHRLGRGLTVMALSAVDIALWDLMAKARGIPLARLLGQVKDRVPTYGSGRASPSLSENELVRTSADYVEMGLKAVKVRVGLDPVSDPRRIAAVRQALGDGVRLMCDANERLDLPTALWLAKGIAEYDVYWFEEPLLADDVTSHAVLAKSAPMAIAVGEHLFTRWEFTPYVEQRAAAILEPDVCLVGGVSEVMRVGELASAHGLAISPHYLTELHIHMAAAMPNSIYVEYFPFLDGMLEDSLKVESGNVLVPDRPGHGLAFQRWVWEKYRVA